MTWAGHQSGDPGLPASARSPVPPVRAGGRQAQRLRSSWTRPISAVAVKADEGEALPAKVLSSACSRGKAASTPRWLSRYRPRY